MVGIQSYGAYIPIYRLNREELAKVWGGGYRKGELAIANSDEDSITMAVEAAVDCLNGIDRESVDGLYFATTTPPYLVKSSASIIAAAADLRRDIFTADFSHSYSAGAKALRAAIDAVAAGSARRVIVVASECQVPPPNSASEPIWGDGAAALLIGADNITAGVEKRHSVSSDIIDIWRKSRGDVYNRTWEDRFVIEKGYQAHLREAIAGLLKSAGLEARDMAKFAYYGPDARSHSSISRALKLEKEQVQDAMFDSLGNTGAAFFMMVLVAALEKAKSGDRIVAAAYGDGADAFLVSVNDDIEKLRDRRGIERHLASKMMLANYGTYLRFRDMMEWEKTPFPEVESSVTVMWRDEKALTRGYGHKCHVCGHVQFPPQRICMWCQAKEQFDYVRLSDRKGKLFTYSLDERAVFALDLPNVIAIVDLDGGGRVYGQLTDRDPDKLELGMSIEMTFRKFHEGAGFHNYAWKCRPVRC
jgi:3-hydroxy-3-methylglutaryl CoA synthase